MAGHEIQLYSSSVSFCLNNEREDIQVMPNSERRAKAVERFQINNPDADYLDVLRFMGQAKDGPAMENYSLMMGILWSIIYLPQSEEMAIRVGLDGKPFTIGVLETASLTVSGTITDRPATLSDYF